MKTTLRSAFIASLLIGSPLFAQTTDVPQGISYQATITDQNGAVIAPLPGAPINYEITLQVFPTAADGTAISTEVFSNVPVSNGRFSVILGQGATTNDLPKPPLVDIFNDESRFVEISVVPSQGGGVSQTFAPRQQLLTSPTAIRSMVAEVAMVTEGFSPDLQAQFNAKAPVTNPSFQGTVGIDSSSSNTGTLFPGLRFGDSTSLEGISSKRTPGVGQYGLSFYTGNRERMTLTGTGLDVAGRLDAGSANIAGNLDLGGRVAASGEILSYSSIAVDSGNTNNGGFSPGLRFGDAGSKAGIASKRTPGGNQNGLSFFTQNTERIIVGFDGVVAIPGDLFAGGDSTTGFTLAAFLGENGAVNTNEFRNDLKHSITAGYRMLAEAYDVESDARIKEVLQVSDKSRDLETLTKIEIVDYHYKDRVRLGSRPQKKVIAQQVEEAFPQAVGQQKNVVPDIYTKAPVVDGWVILGNDLKKGDRVELVTEKATELHQVIEAFQGKFRTDKELEGEQVFVYGREVDDFRFVDYDAIAMLNVSATQELHRRLEAKTREIEEMKKEMAALKGLVSNLQTKDETREARLIAIEKLLAPSSVKTVSK